MSVPAYKSAGEGGKTLLCLNGIGGNKDSFDDQLSALPAGWRGLSWDMPGYGESAPLGEMTLVSPDPRSATVTALEDSSLLHLDTGTMVALLSDEPALAAHVIRFLSQRLRESNATLQNFAFENLSQRLMQKLAELGLKHGSLNKEVLDLGRKYSQSALAEMLGVTREAINKQLKLLQDEGKISMRDGIIQVASPADIVKNIPSR